MIIVAVLTGCAGFLLAVLWMDLIFDSQVLAHRDSPEQLPEPVLASIAAYYQRATTSSRPMSALIALVMAILLAALVFRLIVGNDAGWVMTASIVLAAIPIGLALARTVPNAKRLGARTDSVVEQTRLARAVFTDHVVCLAFMLGFLGLWLSKAA